MLGRAGLSIRSSRWGVQEKQEGGTSCVAGNVQRRKLPQRAETRTPLFPYAGREARSHAESPENDRGLPEDDGGVEQSSCSRRTGM